MEHPSPYWSQPVLCSNPSGVAPAETVVSDHKYESQSPWQVFWASVRAAPAVSGPSALCPAIAHPSHFLSSQSPAQKVRHLPSSLQPNLLPAPAPQAGPWGREQLQSLDLIT